VSFDPLEVVRLDFSSSATAGEDADADMETPDLDLELTYMSESNFYSDVAGNVLGLFVATFVVKAVGTPIAVRLSVPQLDDPFLVSGEVQWVREFSPSIDAPPGMGVELKPLDDLHRRAVDAFMRIRPPILHDDD
jgi:Tfp pilus assembly protein PilZ